MPAVMPALSWSPASEGPISSLDGSGVEGDRQGAELQAGGQRRGALLVEVAGDLRAAVGDDAGEARVGDDLTVEGDGERLVGGLATHQGPADLGQRVGAIAVEAEVDGVVHAVLRDPGAGALDLGAFDDRDREQELLTRVVAGHQRLVRVVVDVDRLPVRGAGEGRELGLRLGVGALLPRQCVGDTALAVGRGGAALRRPIRRPVSRRGGLRGAGRGRRGRAGGGLLGRRGEAGHRAVLRGGGRCRVRLLGRLLGRRGRGVGARTPEPGVAVAEGEDLLVDGRRPSAASATSRKRSWAWRDTTSTRLLSGGPGAPR